jgi:hypothetical protein
MKELNDEIKQALLAPFQSSEIRMRTSPYVAAYVTARVVMTRLDEVLPWQWSFRLAGPGATDANGTLHQDAVLTIHQPEGPSLEYHDRGSAAPDQAKGQAKQAKAAVSDCLKRCAVHAGVGRYLYELTGVANNVVPKAVLEKGLAAVGYRGPWDDRHHGVIGGVREADFEDESGELPRANGAKPTAEAPAAPVEDDVKPAPPAPKTVGMTLVQAKDLCKSLSERAFPGGDGIGAYLKSQGIERTRTVQEYFAANVALDKYLSAMMAGGPSPSGPGATVSQRDRARLADAVKKFGGNVASPSFVKWLSNHTENRAETLDNVLSEDVEDLLVKLTDFESKNSKKRTEVS